MKGWLNHNGTLINEKTPVIMADNRSFRYGDGLFETMKVVMGNILLKDLHFERLFSGMEKLQIHVQGLINADIFEEHILKTIRKNHISGPARVRLTLYRGEGGLYDFNNSHAGYVIQVWPLSSSSLALNDEGHVLGLFEKGKKAVDEFSNIKSNNYLVYAMGAMFAKKNKFHDCLVLNCFDRICDATVANVFWVKNGIVYTTPLSEGCVAGVMRANLLQKLPENGMEVVEKEAVADDLLDADELFLTNAVSGIRWVKQFREKSYSNNVVKKIFHAAI